MRIKDRMGTKLVRFAGEKRGRKREASAAAAAALSLFVGGASSQPGAGCEGRSEVSANAPAGAPSVGEGSSEDKGGCGGSFGPGTQKTPLGCGEG